MILGLGRPFGEGNGNLLQYSCLGNPLGRGSWWGTVHSTNKAKHIFSLQGNEIITKQCLLAYSFMHIIHNILYHVNTKWETMLRKASVMNCCCNILCTSMGLYHSQKKWNMFKYTSFAKTSLFTSRNSIFCFLTPLNCQTPQICSNIMGTTLCFPCLLHSHPIGIPLPSVNCQQLSLYY